MAGAAGRPAVLGGMGPFLLGAAAMFTAMYSTQAILPQLGRDFGVSPSQAGLTVSVVIGALAAGAWLWGPLSDRIGRRASLVLASALLVVPSLLVAVAPTFGLLLAARVLQGLCMPGLLTVGVPYVTEAFTARIGTRAMGYYVSSLVVGGFVGRVGVALATALVGWRVALGAVAALPLLATVVMRRSLPPEPDLPRSSGLSGATLRRLLGNRALIAATVAGSASFGSFLGVFSYLDFRLERAPFGLSAAQIGLVFGLWIMGAAGPAAGRLAGHVGWRAVAGGALGLAATGITISLVPVLAVVVAGLALVALGNFCCVTAAQLGVAASTDRDRGIASALYFSVYYVAGALGGYVPGLAWEAWGWVGVWVLVLAAQLTGIAVVGATAVRGRRSP
ncbi:MFS transporter [Baekduia soli]|uniref:MFS transporter n=1 Tax=Baekduia soli TaxID=496014 RepID=A0A5B8U865_9ACTN|nr:MFS transporter [Baekduia soli]QEC49309.1 MFS transporter [Baekduia soli]